MSAVSEFIDSLVEMLIRALDLCFPDWSVKKYIGLLMLGLAVAGLCLFSVGILFGMKVNAIVAVTLTIPILLTASVGFLLLTQWK